MRKKDEIVINLFEFAALFSPEFRRNSTVLPVLPWRMLRTVALGCRAAFSCASKLEQVTAATMIPTRSE
jgi:hypothetical protein